MSEKPSFNYSFSIDGFGPHYDSNRISGHQFTNPSMNIAIYAENGKGKTFISRAFALDEKKDELSLLDSSNLLSIGKTNGEFSFEIKKDGMPFHKYLVSLNKGNTPTVSNGGNKRFIYHVFNSDYVENNIISKDFSLDGNIDGYIIGKINIDVSNDKEALNNKETEQKDEVSKIEEQIDSAKKDLKKKGINSSLTEYKNINYANLLQNNKIKLSESYETLSEQYTKLKSIPDEIPDLTVVKPQIDNKTLLDAQNILSTKYDIAHFDDEAMQIINSVKSQRDFYEKGLEIYKTQNTKECPFCHTDIDNESMYYLDLYREYFAQAEAQAIADIDKVISALDSLITDIGNYYNRHEKLINNYNRFKKFIPEHAEKNISELSHKGKLAKLCEEVKDLLSSKRDNLQSTEFDISKKISDFDQLLNEINLAFDNDIVLVNKLQSNLNNSNNSRLALVRKICKARFNLLLDECQSSILKISDLSKDINNLSESIKDKESKAKTSKKDIVTNDFKQLLNYFFHDKYSLDEDTFGITFLNETLNERAKHVLSDGEKSIVAFCYYLATTHILVNNEEDYNDLFFIMDDPISSMDFKYVYVVADIIRGLKNYFPQITGHTRYLVLTHNSEFMSILCRNKIAKLKLHLKKGQLVKLKEELLMPYEHHLEDIVRVANEDNPPTHTTPNSIRQVIETIMNFEIPRESSSEKYVHNDPILNKNAFIYSLMQDKSHGVIIKQPSISDDDIIDACKTVVNFVKSKYPEQIKE